MRQPNCCDSPSSITCSSAVISTFHVLPRRSLLVSKVRRHKSTKHTRQPARKTAHVSRTETTLARSSSSWNCTSNGIFVRTMRLWVCDGTCNKLSSSRSRAKSGHGRRFTHQQKLSTPGFSSKNILRKHFYVTRGPMRGLAYGIDSSLLSQLF